MNAPERGLFAVGLFVLGLALAGFAQAAPASPAGPPQPAAGAPPKNPSSGTVTTEPAPLDRAGAGEFRPQDLSVATNLGLLQPFVLGGANLEVDVRYRWLVVSYSHGWSLDLEGDQLTGAMREQGVALHIPFTTGFGVGPSVWFEGIRTFVDLRFEAKVHRFEASYDSEDGSTRTGIVSYETYTLGGGIYATTMPFARSSSPLRGLNASLSFRVWPTVATSLDGGEASYESTRTGQTEVHEAANIGIANTPIIANLSVGYLFQ